jgi:hypothetical protein
LYPRIRGDAIAGRRKIRHGVVPEAKASRRPTLVGTWRQTTAAMPPETEALHRFHDSLCHLAR